MQKNIIWPMGAELAHSSKIDRLWDNPNYVAELKIDGERLTILFDVERVRLFTRGASKSDPSKPIEVTHRWPQIQTINTPDIPRGTVLDGEAFSNIRRAEDIAGLFNHRSKTSMPDDICMVLFDCVFWGNKSLEKNTWVERNAQLLDALDIINSRLLSRAVYSFDHKKEFFEKIISLGGEGVVLKDINSGYSQGKKPANVWVKVKNHDTFDCIITGFKPGKGKYAGMVGSVELSQYKKMRITGELVEYKLFTVCYASGISDELRIAITEKPNSFLGRVAVVEAYERIPKSVTLRQPRIKFIRPEGSKNPEECIIEESVTK